MASGRNEGPLNDNKVEGPGATEEPGWKQTQRYDTHRAQTMIYEPTEAQKSEEAAQRQEEIINVLKGSLRLEACPPESYLPLLYP